MRNQSNANAPKKATNLSLNIELLSEAKRFNINLSAIMEKALIREVTQKQKDEWLKINASAIDACNELAENKGFFSDSFRVL